VIIFEVFKRIYSLKAIIAINLELQAC